VLGLSSDADARLFDLDGVLTQTARVHVAASTSMFNELLAELLRSP
jgi:beta-phosphoglucomutase-like phosphatase (HAD superfamily)